MAEINIAITVTPVFAKFPLPINAVTVTPALKNFDPQIHRELLPVWEGGDAMDYRVFPTVDREGRISGTVKVQNILQHRARVSLYYRKTGALIQSTYTNVQGEFEFKCGLNRDKADYYAVAITEQPFNAQIFDKLTPI